MQSDIVTRLREEGFVTHIARLPRESKILHEAADEIERLRAELAAAIKQRDEARREVCNEIARIRAAIEGVFDPKRVAINRGWDCFAQKEGGGA